MSEKNFLIYRSSAGSGKTFTLVKEYLKLALADKHQPPRHYRSVLAVTFTNKASAEMKERILKSLREISTGKLSDGSQTMQNLLVNELHTDVPELRKRAGFLLQEILHNYADFAICTIDSFVHRIIRTFAYDLQLAVNFNIETDEENILSQCIDTLLSSIGEDEQLTSILLEFSKNRIDENKSWQIETDIRAFASNVMDENNRLRFDKLKGISIGEFVTLKETLQAAIREFENTMKQIADKAFELLKSNGLSPENFYRGRSGIYSYFKKLRDKEFDELLTNYVQQTINDDKWHASKNTDSEKAAVDRISGTIRELFNNAEKLRTAKIKRYYLYRSVYKNIYALTVINEIEKLIRQFKEEQNILFISEFNNRIAEVILKEPVPYIYERIGERYKHFLIDEFQDTSVVQWHNLLPLIDNALAEGKFSMVVGDGKQSIYRWRGGEVEQFAELPRVKNHFGNAFTPQREQNLIQQHSIKQLRSNFRSKAGIIQFNNELFRYFSNALLNDYGKKIYEELEQEYNPANDKGYISIDLITEAEKEIADERVLQTIAAYIALNRKKGFSYRDIAILVRFNNAGNKVADYLMQQGIPVVSSDSLLLGKSPEVALLINLLRYINNTTERVAASAVITYLCAKGFVPKEAEHALLLDLNTNRPTVELEELLPQYNIPFKRNYFLSLPLYDCCVELIRLFELNSMNALYIQFFLDELLSFTQSQASNIGAFTEWWEDRKNKASVILPEGINAVSIMTIHASKGLEFPVVILPFCDWIVKSADYIWIDIEEEDIAGLPATLVRASKDIKQTSYGAAAEEEEEKQVLDNLNLLYVALTRPENHLHIISRTPRHFQENINKWICAYLQQKGLYKKEQYHYEFGDWVDAKVDDENEKTEPVLKPLSLRNWKEIIRIKQSSGKVWDIEMLEEKRDKGIRLHYILSKINTITDVFPAIASCLLEGVLTEKNKTDYEETINHLLQQPVISRFFAPGLRVKNEVEILHSSVETLRPDRIVWDKEIVSVIDYKTGAASEKHHQQLRRYAMALNELGYHEVKKYLIYIQEAEVEEVQ